MNLLLDPWMPLRRRGGAVKMAAPWEITDRRDEDPFVAFASSRADFDGALAQFLIGLLQTALPPARSSDWRKSLAVPPSPATLRQAFQPLVFAFELFGDGPRFLQDLSLEADEHKEQPVESLLIDAAGNSTGRLFVKSGRIAALCPSCAATALLALQLNAPSGGQGHRTGLRGGGPLTTLVVDTEDLWRTLWLNVLQPSALDGDAESRNRPEDRFPWLAPTRTSARGGLDTTLADVHPLQVFWAMPRRLRLRPNPATEPDGGSCSLCARHQQPLVRTFLSRNHGVNYTGPWSHPLTPYRQTEEGVLPLHGSPAGLSYRNWLGLVQNDPDNHIRPARVVEALRAEEERQPTDRPYVLWAFGYDMDNMKARAWLDGRIPLLLVPAEQREALELDASRLVRSAAAGARELVAAAKQAMSGRPKELARDPADVGIRFWQETEAPFYDHLRRIGELLRMGEDTEVARRGWWRELWRTASRAFESATTVGSFDGADPKRVAKAWNGLRRFFHGRKMQQDLLGLPLPPSRTERKGAGVPGDQ